MGYAGSQLDLFAGVKAPMRARKRDPKPSKLAAAAAGEFAGSHAMRILSALKLHGPRTAHELEHLIGLTVVQIDRRVAELRRVGKLQVATDGGGTPITRRTPTGGEATVWEAVA